MSEYRYLLDRAWPRSAGRGRVVWLMLNPSSADEERDDPTIRRCAGFSRRADAAGLTVVNLYGLRSVHPAQLWTHPDPVGPDNDATLITVLSAAAAHRWPVICAWGTCARSARVRAVVDLARAAGVSLLALGLTKDGHPRHPLYVPAAAVPLAYDPALPVQRREGLMSRPRPPRGAPA